MVSFLKVFSVLLFQGVLYFPVKAKERVTSESNRKARGLMDFALESGLWWLVENPSRVHYVVTLGKTLYLHSVSLFGSINNTRDLTKFKQEKGRGGGGDKSDGQTSHPEEDAVFVIYNRSRSELNADTEKPYLFAPLSKLQLKVPWQV